MKIKKKHIDEFDKEGRAKKVPDSTQIMQIKRMVNGEWKEETITIGTEQSIGKKMPEHFWTAYVCVSKAFPDVRYSEFFDIRSHAVDKAKKTKGLKVIKVRVTIA